MSREMKDSSIEWIGKIPKDWGLPKVKQLFIIGRGRVIAKTELDDNRLYPVYSSQTKDGGRLGNIDTYDFDKIQLTWTTDGANAGTVFLREGRYNCTNVCGTLLPKNDKNDVLFIKYALEYIAIFHKRADINGFKIMNNEMAEIVIPLPRNKGDQKEIADYLDEKVSVLDNIITKTTLSIDEYKKYKQSLITEAVTKGLNPEVEMNDSGIEWIGEIPKEWNVIKLKNVVKSPLQYGANESGCEFNKNLPRYIRITDITLDNKLKTNGKLSLPLENSKQYILEEGDILFARSGATVGKTFIYKEKYGLSAFAGYLIKASINISTLSMFIYYYTLSSPYNEWKNRIFIKSTIQNIGADKYSNMEIVIPSILEEQREIVDYLDRKCSEIDNLITQKQQLLIELEAYRKSLIYECVTGKKEVV